MNWEDRTTVQKGLVGEAIVDDWLRSHGYIPYKPAANGAHPFDWLCASRDKRTVFIADAKAKPARTYYPDTGINKRHYEQYLYIQAKHRMHVFLFFVDEDAGKVYGEFLRRLDKPQSIVHNGKHLDYPLEHNGIRYWPLRAMRQIATLSAPQIAELRGLSTRNNAYAKERAGL